MAARFKGILFDLFHTLTGLESEWSDLPSTSEVLGIERPVWDMVLLEGSRWRLVGEERDPYRILRALVDGVDPAISDTLVRSAVQIRAQRFRDAMQRVPPENLRTLRRLRDAGLRLAVVSNCDAIERAAWPGSPLSGLFDAEIFSCDVGCVKPEPAIFRKALERLGLAASDCLFVGDGGSGELQGARTVGLATVFVSGVIAELWPGKVAERIAAADHHVRFVPELIALLEPDAPAIRSATH